jgi:hypothetical protein
VRCIGAKIAKPEFMDAACAGQPPLTVINPRNMTERGGGEQGRDAAESPGDAAYATLIRQSDSHSVHSRTFRRRTLKPGVRTARCKVT